MITIIGCRKPSLQICLRHGTSPGHEGGGHEEAWRSCEDARRDAEEGMAESRLFVLSPAPSLMSQWSVADTTLGPLPATTGSHPVPMFTSSRQSAAFSCPPPPPAAVAVRGFPGQGAGSLQSSPPARGQSRVWSGAFRAVLGHVRGRWWRTFRGRL